MAVGFSAPLISASEIGKKRSLTQALIQVFGASGSRIFRFRRRSDLGTIQ